MKHRSTLLVLVACGATALAASAKAGALHGPIDQGTFALSAERLMGVFRANEKVANNASAGTTVFGLFGNGASNAFQSPRVGLDGFIVDGLSLGGSLGIVHIARENDSSTGILIAPRVGYAYMFSDVVGIWPRGGLSYWTASTSPDNGPGSFSQHDFAFNLDVPLIIAPNQHFAITIGPILDVTFGGKQTTSPGNGQPDRSDDHSLTGFGLSAGVVGFL